MTRKKKEPPSLVRSSAAEYLTFVAATGGFAAIGEAVVAGDERELGGADAVLRRDAA